MRSAAAKPSELSRLPSRIAAASAGVLISRWGKGPVGHFQIEAELKEFLVDGGGKIVGHGESCLLEILGQQKNHLRGPGRRCGQSSRALCA
jgi:hypothetical protein